ncbi:MAG: FISUMP domain-containing protein [Bacteroidales bacterium]
MKRIINMICAASLLLVVATSCEEGDATYAMAKEGSDVNVPEVINLRATPASGSALLEWENPESTDAAVYRITFSPETSLEQPILINAENTAYTLPGLSLGTDYNITVQAVDIGLNTSEGVTVMTSPEASALGSFTDERDGNVYKTIEIGNQVWMAENLRYLPNGAVFSDADEFSTDQTIGEYFYVYDFPGGSVLELEANANRYEWYQEIGVLYNWYAAIGIFEEGITDIEDANAFASSGEPIQGACPKGWHLPTRAECETLFNFVGGNAKAAGLLKVPGRWGPKQLSTDADPYLFSWLPSGRAFNGKFDGYIANGKQYAYIWTATPFSKSIATSFYASGHGTAVTMRENYSNNSAICIRCLKDNE